MKMAESYCALFKASCLHSRRNFSILENGLVHAWVTILIKQSQKEDPKKSARRQRRRKGQRTWSFVREVTPDVDRVAV